jgi:hypothetical protein
MLTAQDIYELEHPLAWEPGLVFHRLAEATLVCSWCVAAVGPSKMRGFWPASRDPFDAIPMPSEAERDGAPRRATATRGQIDRMHEAMQWPFDHLPDTPARAMLAQLVRVRTLGGNYRKLCKARGWGKTHAYESAHAALERLTRGLRRARVPVRL